MRSAWLGFVAVLLVGSSLLGREAAGLEGAVDIVGPPGSDSFGEAVTVLPNGNIVVTDSDFDGTVADGGAVHLYDGETLLLISTLEGGGAFDSVGYDGVAVLADGDFVVRSSFWDDPVNGIADVGAVTLCSGTTGCDGVVTAANSLVGATASDLVGRTAVLALANGGYVVSSEFWNRPEPPTAAVGAGTFCNGTTGCTGLVSAANSLIGSTFNDRVGRSVYTLPNGNYLLWSNVWDNGALADAGALAFCNGTTGCSGTASSANSLVGGTLNDYIGNPTILANGNYVAKSPNWNNPATPLIADVGAATFCSGTTGCTGLVSTDNSLVGGSASDQVGNFAVALPNGHYVAGAPSWDDPVSGTASVGAMTWCSGTTGCTGAVTAANSLIGGRPSDLIGASSPGVIALPNGDYVVGSPFWDDPAPKNDVGAATRCPGTAGGCAGMVVGAANSLIGGSVTDQVAFRGVYALTNGNYIVASQNWDNPAPLRTNVGAVTFCSGATGCAGMLVGAANSVIGSTANDQIGDDRPAALANGSYVVTGRQWDQPSPFVLDVGVVVRCDGTTGCAGEIDPLQALVGAAPNDRIGSNGTTPLTNGNYVLGSPNANAVTFCKGATGCVGVVDASNSLVGASENDDVGYAFVDALPSGDYVVVAEDWDDPLGSPNSGAATLGDGVVGTVGVINDANSVLGTTGDDIDFGSVVYDPVGRRLLVGRSKNNVVTVPEPGVGALGAAALAALLARSARRGA